MGTTDQKKTIPEQLLGKPFGASGLEWVREELRRGTGCSRSELARRVCVRLNWRSPGGAYQFMSARVGLLRLHRAGWIALPESRLGPGLERQFQRRPVAPVAPHPVAWRADRIPGLFLQRVDQPALSAIYNGLMEQYHYLGCRLLAGAQARYLIGWQEGWMGAISFGGACYRAANWRCLGQTLGRGKKGQRHEVPLARKSVWVYPLRPDFRAVLRGEEPA